jgi:hypothetical protein
MLLILYEVMLEISIKINIMAEGHEQRYADYHKKITVHY